MGKKIVIQIGEDGSLNAETFGMFGTECMDELDKIMKDIANSGTNDKKKEFYEQKSSQTQVIKNKNG